MNDTESRNSLILGQKYAFATISLVLGIFSFINLFGLEKPILAIVFGWLALRSKPEPRLLAHRLWAKTGVVLGTLTLIVVPILILLNFERLSETLKVLSAVTGGR